MRNESKHFNHHEKNESSKVEIAPAPKEHDSLPFWKGESGVDGFDGMGIYVVSSIVDREIMGRATPHETLDKVTVDNIDDILAEADSRLRLEREAYNANGGMGDTPTQVIERLGQRSSKSHAIQCSTNRAIDMRDAWKVVAKHAEEQEISAQDQVLRFTERTYMRQAVMSEVLAELHRMDIARRIGKEKNDSTFFARIDSAWKGITQTVETVLARLEKENGALTKGHRDMTMRIARIKDFLATTDLKEREAGFYESLCEDLGKLILQDFEELNEPRLITSAKWLESRGPSRTT